MADQTPRELLQPALLDRLTDDEPQKQVEARDQRIMSMRHFREAVMRDLAWLLNTGNYDNEDLFTDYPNVADSVINFGIRDLCGLTTSGITEGEVERYVRDAIRRFEPRDRPELTARFDRFREALASAVVAQGQGRGVGDSLAGGQDPT